MPGNPFASLRRQKFLYPVLLLLALAGCGGDGGNSAESPVTLTTQDYTIQYGSVVPQETFLSSVTGINYPIDVYLPEGYNASLDQYPVVYATDGQWVFDGFAWALDSMHKAVILVAIGQGPDDRRAIDYLPAGAPAYYQFLTTELLPYVETRYRVDQTNRSLTGTSYGGLLVAHVLLMESPVTPFFHNYLAMDGSFWVDPAATSALEANRYMLSADMPATLILTSATLFQGNDSWVTQFQQKLEARNYIGLSMHRTRYAVAHNDVAQPSFEDAVRLLFP